MINGEDYRKRVERLYQAAIKPYRDAFTKKQAFEDYKALLEIAIWRSIKKTEVLKELFGNAKG